MQQIYHLNPNNTSKSFVKGYFITKPTIVGYFTLFVVFLAFSALDLDLHLWLKATIGIVLSLLAIFLLDHSESYIVQNSPYFILNEIKRISKKKRFHQRSRTYFFGIPECDLIFYDTNFLLKFYKNSLVEIQEFLLDIDEKKYEKQKLFDLENRLKYLIELLNLIKKEKKNFHY